MEVVKVSAKSVPKSVAGAIAAVIRENGEVEVQAVGAGASNQAVSYCNIQKLYGFIRRGSCLHSRFHNCQH